MNLLTETQKKLNNSITRLEDLENCLTNAKLTKDCMHYVNDEITKVIHNVQYYKKIKEILTKE